MTAQNIEDRIAVIAGRKPRILGYEDYYKSAVLLPLVTQDGACSLLFEKRSSALKIQPGEICFPGGGIETTDDGAMDAAIRESCEELGLEPDDIEMLGPLDYFVSPFNLIVYPFAAYLKNPGKIKPNPDEVEYVFTVPVDYLLNVKPPKSKLELKLVLPEGYPYDLIPNGRDYPFRQAQYPQYFYLWNNEVIWGLTARILNHFLSLLGN